MPCHQLITFPNSLNICNWDILCLLLIYFFFKLDFLRKKSQEERNTIRVSNSLDPDQAVEPLDPYCLRAGGIFVFITGILTHKAPPIICSRRQFQIWPLFQK